MILEFGMEAILSATASHKQNPQSPWWTDQVKRKAHGSIWRTQLTFLITPVFCKVTSSNPTNPPSRQPRGHRSLPVDGVPSRRCIGQRPSREPGNGGGWLEVKYMDGWWMMWMIWMISSYILKIKSEIWALLKRQLVYICMWRVGQEMKKQKHEKQDYHIISRICL